MKSFVPLEFKVPMCLEHRLFVLRPLRISDVVKDYDAVMSSVPDLRNLFGPQSTWPDENLSFEQDLIDLGWHHKEFQTRRSFAYTVMDPAESQCLGCAYLYPTGAAGYQAEAYCWIRTSRREELDALLYATFNQWLVDCWPFASVAFPGRAQSWESWSVLKRGSNA